MKTEYIAAHYFLWHFINLGVENFKFNLGHVTVDDTIFKLSSLICKVEIISIKNKWQDISKIFSRV